VFFLDRSVESASVAAALRDAGVEVRLHGDFFADDAKDEMWLPDVARRGWIVLTRDKWIRRRPLEKQALIASGARAFVLTWGNLRGREMAEILVKHIHKMDRLARITEPPFVFAVTKTGVESRPL
jgi:hypothetical protein